MDEVERVRFGAVKVAVAWIMGVVILAILSGIIPGLMLLFAANVTFVSGFWAGEIVFGVWAYTIALRKEVVRYNRGG